MAGGQNKIKPPSTISMYLERTGAAVKAGAAYRLVDGIEEKLESLDEERWELAY